MLRTLPPALTYAAVTFAGGFVLGALRVTWLAPQVGDLAAVAMELPLMLAWSWWVAGRVLGRWPLPRGGARLAMGAMAFAALMVFEAATAVAFGGPLSAFVTGFASPHGALGLAGQIGFALIPFLRR
jgi:hypothetical protein